MQRMQRLGLCTLLIFLFHSLSLSFPLIPLLSMQPSIVDVHLSAFSFLFSFFFFWDGGPAHDVQGAGEKICTPTRWGGDRKMNQPLLCMCAVFGLRIN